MHKLRNPDNYVWGFHLAVERGEGELFYETRAKGDLERRRFRVFLWNLRQFPLHRLHEREKGLRFKTELERQGNGSWRLRIWSEPRGEIETALEKALIGES